MNDEVDETIAMVSLLIINLSYQRNLQISVAFVWAYRPNNVLEVPSSQH